MGQPRSELEAILVNRVERAGLPAPVLGYRFAAPDRRWAFDLAWPAYSVAAECEGGTWTGGRHVRGAGFARDAEKYNTAAIRGWAVLRFTRAMIESGEAVYTIQAALWATGRYQEGQR